MENKNIEETMNYEKIDNKINQIIKSAKIYIINKDLDIDAEIKKAYLYALEAHEGQFRLSGEPYIIHPVEATEILLSLKPDLNTIQACLLHDVIEDTDCTGEDIEEKFGSDVRLLCEGMEKLGRVRYTGEDRSIGSLRKMFIAMAEDLRVIFIKLADRTHNMQTLCFHPKPEKRERIALETLNIYAPIADRLGLYHIKNRLEEECFKVLEPDDYEKIISEFNELEDSMKLFSKYSEKEIRKLLDDNGIKNYEVDYRIKSIYSIYKKMQKKKLDSIKSLYDLFGIRIIVDDETTCYRILGLIHKNWTPLPKRFKDYVALPKPNGYKSIHTTVIGLLKEYRKQPTEIQIKTFEMKEFSDIGVAAHFEYKEKGSVKAVGIDWVKELKELTNDLENTDFVNSLKIDVFKDRIFAFTPKGDLINLPVGSTPIDFAYYLHSDLGDKISIAKINGEVKTLDKELHNGDIIEIVIDKNKKPNPFWLSFVKTTKAKNRIKSSLKKENKDLYRERGKEILEKYLNKTGLFELDKELSILKVLDGRENKIEERYGLLEQIGNFSTPPSAIFKKILKEKNIVLDSTKKKGSKITLPDSDEIIEKAKKNSLVIGGEEGLEYNFCECCTGKNLKRLVAHINRDSKITIHKRNCEIIENVNNERLLSAYEPSLQLECLEVSIVFSVLNKRGILKAISDILYIMEINIEEINYEKISKYKGDITLVLEVSDYDYLIIDRLIDRIKNSLKKDLLGFNLKNLK